MNDLVHIIELGSEDERITRGGGADAGPVLGAWYWVTGNVDHNDEPEPDWLGCAMKIGSNFVELHTPHHDKGGYSHIRIHFEDFWTRLRHEPNADAVIRARIGHWQGESNRLLAEVERVTQSLGMTPQAKIGDDAAPAAESSGALMVLSGQEDPHAYSTALTVAKETTLPALFKDIKQANEQLATWMKAPVMPTLAAMKDQRALVADIDDRIFSVSLYAGLTEDAEKVADGPPATIDDKLHVMQRMAFMDEECLANYKTGGMEFANLREFDAWLAQPENRDRILPFPRTLAALRVRRSSKSRDWQGSVRTLKLNFEKEQLDKLTFLYVRNGEQLWRISTEIDFGDLIFPDPSVFNPNEPKMMKMWGSQRVEGFISVARYEEMLADNAAMKAKQEEWRAAYTGTNAWFDMPYALRTPHENMRDYKPFDPSSVYYDDGMKEIEREIKHYNRVALIIQGLFDRSLALHPHLPAKTWTADGFDRAVKLVEDGTNVLHFGEAPDFEAYRARCNASLREGSMCIGQDDYWQRVEGERESARLDRDWRTKSDYRPERFKPYGNPGPGYIARAVRVTKGGGKVTFNWERKRLKEPGYWERHTKGDTIPTSITVPAAELFNVDAYKPGDFKPFFADPRTRAQYLKWAPMLIAAEEYHAAKAKENAR